MVTGRGILSLLVAISGLLVVLSGCGVVVADPTLLMRIFRQVTFLRPVSAVSGIPTARQGISRRRETAVY
jgi:hypothetical protein